MFSAMMYMAGLYMTAYYSDLYTIILSFQTETPIIWKELFWCLRLLKHVYETEIKRHFSNFPLLTATAGKAGQSVWLPIYYRKYG